MDINQIKKILKKVIADKENWIRYQDGSYTKFVCHNKIIFLSLTQAYFIETDKKDLIIEGNFSEELDLVAYKEEINLKDWP